MTAFFGGIGSKCRVEYDVWSAILYAAHVQRWGLRGYSHAGQFYTAAVSNYKKRNNAPPTAVKNRVVMQRNVG